MTSTRSYRGVSADDRREQRRAQLVETALDCLHEDGLAGVSVRAICARARLTPRYFYESFTDLDALLLAAVDAVLDEVIETSAAAVLASAARAPDDTAAQVRAAIETGYGIVATDRRKADVLLVAAAGDAALRARRYRLVTDGVDRVIDGLTVLQRSTAAERTAARATAVFLMGGTADLIEAVLSGRIAMTRTRVVDQLTALWLGALQSALASAAGGSGTGRSTRR